MLNRYSSICNQDIYRKAAKTLFFIGVFTTPAFAASCPATPGNLPIGRARWTEKGDERWLLTTDDKKSYPCLPPKERKERDREELLTTNYEYTDFICSPLLLTVKKCVMDESRSYSVHGAEKDLYTALCNLGGSRWSYSLIDKNGEKFTLLGLPGFSRWSPNAIEKKCSNTHSMEIRSAWVFKSGEKFIYINRLQSYIATAVRQPSL
jgi:hypothetical protein